MNTDYERQSYKTFYKQKVLHPCFLYTMGLFTTSSNNSRLQTGSSHLSNLWFTSCSAILYVHQTIHWQDSFHEDKHFFSWKKIFLFVKINISFHENNSPHCKSRSQQHACKRHGRRITVCQKTHHSYPVRHQNCGNTSIFSFHHTTPYRSKCTRWKQKKHINWTNVNLSALLIKSR